MSIVAHTMNIRFHRETKSQNSEYVLGVSIVAHTMNMRLHKTSVNSEHVLGMSIVAHTMNTPSLQKCKRRCGSSQSRWEHHCKKNPTSIRIRIDSDPETYTMRQIENCTFSNGYSLNPTARSLAVD